VKKDDTRQVEVQMGESDRPMGPKPYILHSTTPLKTKDQTTDKEGPLPPPTHTTTTTHPTTPPHPTQGKSQKKTRPRTRASGLSCLGPFSFFFPPPG
jgi:hypothetical protein